MERDALPESAPRSPGHHAGSVPRIVAASAVAVPRLPLGGMKARAVGHSRNQPPAHAAQQAASEPPSLGDDYAPPSIDRSCATFSHEGGMGG